MKRRLLIIAICLLGGAVANVAVAWGCGLWFPRSDMTRVTSETNAIWPLPVPEWWPSPTSGQRRSGFGVDYENLAGHLSGNDNQEPDHIYQIAIYKGGWPYHSLRAEWRSAYTSMIFVDEWRGALNPPWLRPRGQRPLPLKPIWPGFLINTLFYAALLWALIAGPFALRRFLRVRRGLCPKCAYPMGESSVCSECGGALAKRVSTT